MRKVIYLILGLFINDLCFAQHSYNEELSKLVTPINLNNYLQYSFLSQLLENNKILALGEETHGTSEFFTVKTDIIKYSVTHLNYKLLLIEADACGTDSINQYITNGIGTAKIGLMKLGTAAWMTNEMLQLVEWLRIYNSENSQANWVLFYGIDMQWSTNIIRQLNTQYLKPEMLSSNSKRHLDSVSKFASTSYQNRDTLLMYELRELGYSHFDSIENYKRLVSLLGQYLALKQEVDEIKKSKLRDEFMAQNAIQLCKLVDKKGILWAHNEHITKTSNMLKYYPLGYYLSNEFGMKYYSIGLHTCQGKIGFYNKISRDVNYIDIPVDHSSSSLSFILSKVDFQAFFFDINDLSNKSTQNNKLLKREVRIRAATLYFDNKHNSYRVAVQNRKSILAKNYNAIVYINPSSGATPFKIKTD